jgi:23S rRNA pseudouridine1911/1915/1917 synthase
MNPDQSADPLLETPASSATQTLAIVFQDEYCVIIDKPAGIAAEPSKGWRGTDVVSLLQDQGYENLQLVSRLDVGTSGLMMIPKTDQAYLEFKNLYKNRSVQKVYLALVEGWLKEDQALIDAPIARRRGKDVRLGVVEGGRQAQTEYRTIKKFEFHSENPEQPDSSSKAQQTLTCELVEAHPLTGRTHQIRVHFSALGHPIVGDTLYGARQGFPLERFFLQATELHFVHPFTQIRWDFKIPLAPKLQSWLDRLTPIS